MDIAKIRKTINESDIGRTVNAVPQNSKEKFKRTISDILGADYRPLLQLVPLVGLGEIYRKEKAGEGHVWSPDADGFTAYITCIIHAAPLILANQYLVDTYLK